MTFLPEKSRHIMLPKGMVPQTGEIIPPTRPAGDAGLLQMYADIDIGSFSDDPGETDEELKQKLIARCEEWFEESRQWTADQRKRWRKNERLRENDIPVPGPDGATKQRINLALATIETIKPIIADYMPTFDVAPEESNDIPFSDMLQKRTRQVEEKSDLRDGMMDCVDDMLLYSNGILHIQPLLNEPDATEEMKKQAIEVIIRDPFTWYPAPGSRGMNIKKWEARYHIFATPMHVDEILQRYKATVPAEGWLDEQQVFQEISEKGGDGGQTKANQALVKECYYMDNDVATYQNGRQVMWANGVLIDDRQIPYERIPEFMLKNLGSAHAIFGMGEPQLIETQVKSLNQVMSSIADNINKAGNPVRKIMRNWWNNAVKKISGTVAGEDVVVDNPNEISWLEPPPLPQYIFNYLEVLLRLVDVVTGVQDVTEGRKPTGVTAGTAIAALQEAAERRVRYTISKDLTKFVKDIGRFVVEVLKTMDREIIEIRKKDANGQNEFVQYNPKMKIDSKGVPEGEEEFNAEDPEMRGLADSKLEVEVVAGMSQPGGRVATEARAIEKFEKGIYGIEQVVNSLAEPNKKEIIDGWYQRNGLMAMKQEAGEMEKAQGEFRKYIDEAMKSVDEQITDEQTNRQAAWIGSLDEERLAQLLKQFPKLMGTEEFQVLPDEYKERLITVFLRKDDTGLAEQKQPAGQNTENVFLE